MPAHSRSGIPGERLALISRGAGHQERIDLIAITVLAFLLYAVSSFRPDAAVLDEDRYAAAAHDFLNGTVLEYGMPINYEHPPLAKQFLGASIVMFGDHPASWRLTNAIAGAGGLGAVYLIGRRWFDSRRTGLAAAGLLFMDNLWFVSSKTFLLDTTSMALLLGAFAAALRPAREPWVVPCLLGLAVACKLPALWGAPMLFYVWLRGRAPPRDYRVLRRLAQFGTVSVLTFLATYLPYDAAWARVGGLASVPSSLTRTLGYLVTYHRGRHWIGFHTDPVRWFAFARSHQWYRATQGSDQVAIVTDVGNPLIWWGAAALLLVGLAAIAYQRVARGSVLARVLGGPRIPVFLLLALSTISMWLPFVLLSRREYQYYMVEVLPFLALLEAAFLASWWQRPRGRPLVAGILVVTGIAFLALLPFGEGWFVSTGYAETVLPRSFLAAPWP